MPSHHHGNTDNLPKYGARTERNSTMPQTSPTPNQRLVTELKVSAHLMLLDPGLFCIFHAPGAPAPDPATGLPGVRVSQPPTTIEGMLSISTFNADGWLGGEGNAALVRVGSQPAHVLITIYQAAGSAAEAPKLQVLRLSEVAGARTAQPLPPAEVRSAPPADSHPAGTPQAGAAPAGTKLEVAAHVQRRGDLLSRLGEWMGQRGSQNWIEGFGISPNSLVDPGEIEYQAVLGKGWLSPWSEGGNYCGSRGMALPILGLRVRLKGQAADRFDIRVSASFTDGSQVGPVDGTQTAESPDLAPLEAFLVEILPREGARMGAVPDEDEPEPEAAPRRSIGRGVSAKPSRAAPAPAKPKVAALKRGVRKPPDKPSPKPLRGAAAMPTRHSGPPGKAGGKGRR